MANRVSVVTTRTGDKGQTRLGDNSKVEKDAPRIEALGTIDELNCTIGVLRAHQVPKEVDELLFKIQNELFDLGGEVCIPNHPGLIKDEQIKKLEAIIKAYSKEFGPLREFILPGGSPAGAQAHVARCVCRRAERRLVSLSGIEPVNPPAKKYLNRLSDLFFVLARILNRDAGVEDVMWDH